MSRVTMALRDVKACKACQSSKRKCTKQQPRCQRCELRGLQCMYEPLPRVFLYRAGDQCTPMTPDHVETHDANTSRQNSADGNLLTLDHQRRSFDENNHDSAITLSWEDLKSAWFLDPDSCRSVPLQSTNRAYLTTDMIRDLLYKTKNWLSDWVATGSNVFIHAEIYKSSLPEAICDAFTALSAYLSRTDKTTNMVLQIMEQKADKLIKTEATAEPSKSNLHNLSRVHALLVYCTIRLLDGDPRQRYKAEQHLQTLQEWTQEMIADTSEAIVSGDIILQNHLTDRGPRYLTFPLLLGQFSPEQLLWHAWILSESIRRTWCVAMGLQSGYELLKTESGPCYGTLPITMRKGLWTTDNAFSWTKMCAESNVGFLCRNEHEKILSEMSADDIDPFALCMMDLDIGPDRMARWKSGHEA